VAVICVFVCVYVCGVGEIGSVCGLCVHAHVYACVVYSLMHVNACVRVCDRKRVRLYVCVG